MADPAQGPDQAEVDRWHRNFAAALFNHSWDLLERPDRTPADDDELLATVFASRYHWGRVGDASHRAVGDGQIARVCATLGHADLAVQYASQALGVIEQEGWTDYRLASAYEVLARAHAAGGNKAERDQYVERARAAIEALDDPEDRQVIGDQLASVPPVA